MPTYEMPLLLRVMKKSECKEALKRVANSIFETGGFIRKIENLGEKELPCKASSHGKVHKHASHFLFYFDVPPSSLADLSDECRRDMDIIRSHIYTKNELLKEKECTLQEELLPPAYRPSVMNLLEEAKKQRSEKYKFKYNSGLDYYPFSR